MIIFHRVTFKKQNPGNGGKSYVEYIKNRNNSYDNSSFIMFSYDSLIKAIQWKEYESTMFAA